MGNNGKGEENRGRGGVGDEIASVIVLALSDAPISAAKEVEGMSTTGESA